jgi:hypothetical protein
VLDRQSEVVDAVEVGPDLSEGQPQVGGPELDQVAAGPKARQRQSRVGSGAHDQVQLGWSVLEQE